MVSKDIFAKTDDGKTVVSYKIENKKGEYAVVLDYGGIIQKLCIKDKNGNLRDVVLGYDTLNGYVKHRDNYIGSCVGRYANRIGNGRFTLNGTEYNVSINDGQNTLHGGNDGFNVKYFTLRHEDANSVTLRYVSPDMEEGFPGKLTMDVTYRFTDESELEIIYDAISDSDTVFSPTNHSYFNLNGHGAANNYEHTLQINSDYFYEAGEDCLPDGALVPVCNVLDFRSPRYMGDLLRARDENEYTKPFHGYDYAFMLRGADEGAMTENAVLKGLDSGIVMKTYSNMPAIQLYTTNFPNVVSAGKGGVRYDVYRAICLETEFAPDSVNHPEWPSPVLRKDERKTYKTVYAFSCPKSERNIVILDGYTSNPGDISWKPIEKFGNITEYDRTPPELIVERAKDADAIILNKVIITKEIMDALPRLRYIGLFSTGANTVDLKYAKEKGITVCNVPGYSTEDVAQMTFALILELALHAQTHSDTVREGGWTMSKDFCYWKYPLIELAGKTLGIIGYGAIGSRVCEIARAFHMDVIVNTRTPKPLPEGVRAVSKEELFSEADIITLHCPLTEENAKLINEEAISLMKKNAFVINTARGGLVDEEALSKALNEGRIAGAGLDVLSTEPPKPDNLMLTAKNCIITPHISWAAQNARVRLIDTVASNYENFLAGKKVNNV